MSNFLEKRALSVNGIEFLEQFLVGHDGFIAGGCFKNIFNHERIKDIDLFFKDQTNFQNGLDYFNSHGGDREITNAEDIMYEFVYRNNKCVCFKHLKSGINVELIETIFGTPEEILERFDFTIAKYALYIKFEVKYHGEITNDKLEMIQVLMMNETQREELNCDYNHVLTAVYHPDFWEHLYQKKLVIDDLIPFPVSTFERILKYQGYGYSPCNETKKKIIRAINEKPNIDEDEFSSSMYGAASGGWD